MARSAPAPDAAAVALRTMAPAPAGSIAALRGRSVSPHLTRLDRAVFRSTRDGLFQPARDFATVQLLLGHAKLESTVRYLGIEVEDALAIAEQVDV